MVVGSPGSAQEASKLAFELDDEYSRLVMLLDRQAAFQAVAATVPETTGAEMAFIGVPDGDDKIVLAHSVRAVTRALDRVAIPAGWGLGGKVLATHRPHWVGDYCTATSIAHIDRVDSSVSAEGLHGILAVPITHHDRFLGVLYAGHRSVTSFGSRTIDAMLAAAKHAATAIVVAEQARHNTEVAVHEERRRLALELHESVGAMLFAIGAGVKGLEREPGLDPRLLSRLSVIQQQASEAAATLRLSLQALNSPPLEVALGVALRSDCRSFHERTGVAARLVVLSDVPTLAPSATKALADSVREALLNVEKHARAHSAVVTLSAQREGVAVVVADDGVGLPAEGVESRGLGLQGISDRLARLGGCASIDRNEDGGMTLRLWMPC
jgi:LuxR family transcriptional regulator, regulator of acetate metabolism